MNGLCAVPLTKLGQVAGWIVGNSHLTGRIRTNAAPSPGVRLDPPSQRLLPRKLMLTKERPHLPGRVYAAAIRPEHPLRRDPLAAGPLMAFSLDCVEHHVPIVSAVRVLQARHIRGEGRFDGVRSALVVATTPQGARDTRKCAAGGFDQPPQL